MDKQKRSNFMRQFRNKTNHEVSEISSEQLLLIWDHYDEDGNGFIENCELDSFLKEFVSSVCHNDVGDEVVSKAMLEELKKDFLEAYDENNDGKIEIRELAQMLPTDENFLLLFQLDNRIHSSVEFMKIWKKFDKDNSGFIEAEELKGFLKELLCDKVEAHKVTDAKLAEYTATLIRIFDENKDGKLQLSEMARLLPVKENALHSTLSRNFFHNSNAITPHNIKDIFKSYDKNDSGQIEGDEISGFVKDLMAMMHPNYTSADVSAFQDLLMKSCDLDGDGKLSKEELTLMMLGLQRFYK